MVFAAIEKNLPEVGDKGTLLDYQGHYDDPLSKKIKENETGKEDTHVVDNSQYYETFNTNDNSAYDYQYEDSSAYAYKYDVAAGEEFAEITLINGIAAGSTEDSVDVPKEELTAGGLVAYGSDSDNE